jgi:alpha-mannosidase
MKKVSANELPEYFGELYLELHRGTYTTNHNLKMYNRRLEEALHDAELISVLKDDREAKTLTDGLYDTLMLNQFHDILPGTCIAEATDVALAEQAAALSKAKDYISGKGKKGKKSYFNTLPHSRLEILSTDSGQAYEALDGMRVVAPYKFEGCGYGKKVKGSGKIPFTVQGDTVKTPFLEATFTEGKISSLIYKGRELARGGIHLIKAYEDVPFIYDNWDIDVDYRLKEKPVKFLSREVITVGEYLLVVRITHAIAENSLLVTDVKFRYDSPQIEFENHLTAGDVHTLIRAEHDTTLFAQSYKCETQFGNLLRNSYNREKSDIAKFEVCAHKWTDLSEQGMGISLLSDVKYGVSCQGGRLGITLHKSGTHPDARGDRGESYFGYALYPHEGGLSMDTVERGYNFNYAPVRTSHQELEAPFRLVGEGSVILETVKQGEDDGIVLRLYEALGATSSVTLIAPQKEMISTNILEDEEATLGRGEVTLTFSPFEIKTIKLK